MIAALLLFLLVGLLGFDLGYSLRRLREPKELTRLRGEVYHLHGLVTTYDEIMGTALKAAVQVLNRNEERS